jgi:hypothetical protein
MLADVRAYFESIGIPEDGGPGHKAFTLKTTGEAFDITMSADWLLTDLARTLRIRKSLVMCPLLWELRQQNIDEPFADEAVRDHYEGTGVSPSTDSSTGLAQIRAATAISSRNYCIAQQIIGGTSMDPASEADLWPVWQRLNEDDVYNISTIPLVHIWGANDIGQRRPGLDYSEAESQAVLARYVGTGDEPDNIGRQQLGLFRVFEKYNAPMRAR